VQIDDWAEVAARLMALWIALLKPLPPPETLSAWRRSRRRFSISAEVRDVVAVLEAEPDVGRGEGHVAVDGGGLARIRSAVGILPSTSVSPSR
jgi:hypothetical protein